MDITVGQQLGDKTTSREWHLAQRPVGTPTAADFRMETVELPDLGAGEVRVRNRFLSVDPYMRGRMNDVKSYIPPFQLDQALTGSLGALVLYARAAG